MEHSERIIELSFKRQHFEEIYFKDRQGNILLSRLVRKPLIALLVIFTLLIGSILYSWLTNEAAALVVILLMFLIITLLIYGKTAYAILKWRRAIVKYMDEHSRFKSQKLILTESSLSVIQDNVEAIYKWSVFTNAVIEENYVTLKGADLYLFPKKSMSLEDYGYFTQMVRSQLKSNL
jgi:hypothetical protein